jgi:hypothetical protein
MMLANVWPTVLDRNSVLRAVVQKVFLVLYPSAHKRDVSDNPNAPQHLCIQSQTLDF